MATQWNIGLDIGSANVRMAALSRGILIRQSAAVALRRGAPAPLAYGNDAQALLGRTPGATEIAYPIQGGAVAREDALSFWLQMLFSQAEAQGFTRRPRVLIALPPALPRGASRHLTAQIMEAGALSCSAIRADAAAALGSDWDVKKPGAILLADVGAGHVSASLLAGGRTLRSASLPFGLDEADAAICRAVLVKQRLQIGPRAAQELKTTLGAAASSPSLAHTVSGLDAESGFPRERAVSSEQVKAALRGIVDATVELVLSVLDGATPEVAQDLIENGILLTGGGAQLYGLDQRLAEATGLCARVPEDPSGAVIRGVLRVMDKSEAYESLTEPLQKLFDKRA